MPSLAPLSPENQMAYEYQTLRLFTGGHVMETLRPRLTDQVLSSRQLDQVPDGARISAAGKVLRRQRPLGKMVFMTLQGRVRDDPAGRLAVDHGSGTATTCRLHWYWWKG